MKKLILVVGMSLLAVVIAKAQDPAKVDPKHYKVIFNPRFPLFLPRLLSTPAGGVNNEPRVA